MGASNVQGAVTTQLSSRLLLLAFPPLQGLEGFQAFGLQENDKCECGVKETVVHVLINCLRVRGQRQSLCKDVGV